MYLMKISTQGRNFYMLAGFGITLFLLSFSLSGICQPKLSLELIKPKQYESRTLPSEKSTTTGFSVPKRFYNNLVSRFNYYFNANNKLDELLIQSKETHKDDYTQLLSFYNYQLDTLAKSEVDSIIYKCTAGILLHDLRSDWVDKLYLLMGKAYLFRRDFDSATNVFQYINYAFAPKDNGYDIPIGSNASNTAGVFTIATRENKSVWKKLMSFPPSRNESFLWQARTYIEQEAYVEAGSLLEIIRTDPNFPERLQTDLHELTAYLLYKEKNYAGAAFQLSKSLDNAVTRFEKARWEYLIAQLYELADKPNDAITYFEKSIQHTTDPLMEVYARLAIVSLASGNQEDAIQKNLNELLRMAKKDKYETHRDIIYYAAAELELKRKNYSAAQILLLNSIKYNNDNILQRQKSFLLLGDMNYTRKEYGFSYDFYDSLQVSSLKEADQQRVEERKPALQIISENLKIVKLEDSLQLIAKLPEIERDAYLKKLLKRLRKEKGLKESAKEEIGFGSNLPPVAATSSLFGGSSSDFYFQNASLKAKGTADYKARWGNRPNVDNWRRQSAVQQTLTTNTPDPNSKTMEGPKKEKEDNLNLESLSGNIPLTTGQKETSDQAIIKALLTNALTFQNKLEDYPTAIEVYEELLKRYPNCSELEQVMFNLAYCYQKNRQYAQSDSLTLALKSNFAGGKYVTQLAQASAAKQKDPAQDTYEKVYGLFVQGRFTEAKEAKLQADKVFGKSYWTPQLLYIESIYYIKQKEDSTAIDRLENIKALFKTSPLAEKATTMIDVLNRRKEIEFYLTNLKIERPEDILAKNVDLNSTNTLGIDINKPDSLLKAPKTIQAAPKALADLSNVKTVATALDKPDSLRKAPTQVKADLKNLTDLSNSNTISSAPMGMKDSPANVPKELTSKVISSQLKPNVIKGNMYTFNPSDTQFVILILDNVDPIYISEGKNAFNRFNKDRFPEQNIEIYNRRLNSQYQLLLFGPFINSAEAISYIDKTRPLATTRIVPWLTQDKFSFNIISNANIEILLKDLDLSGYRAFMHEIFPDKF